MKPIDKKAKRWLQDLTGHNVLFDEPMYRHTSLGVGGNAEAYVEIACSGQYEFVISKLIKGLNKRKISYFVMGDGTNLLVKDTGIPGVTISLKKGSNKIQISEEGLDKVVVTAIASEKIQKLCRMAIRKGYGGLNFAVGIPGTIGGGIMMNAGTLVGRMQDVIASVKILMPSGDIEVIQRKDLVFSYRKLSFNNMDINSNKNKFVILNGTFLLHIDDPERLKVEADKILDDRRCKHPIKSPSAGCFFKNPGGDKTAGQLIELAGLKDHWIGGAAVSRKHANFIINKGKATASDVLALKNVIQKEVFKQFNIKLETEVIIVGREANEQKSI